MANHSELIPQLENSLFSDYLAGVVVKDAPGNPFEVNMIKIGDGLDFGTINLSMRNLWKGLQASNPQAITRLIGKQAFYQMIGLSRHLGHEVNPGLAAEVITEVQTGSLLAVCANDGTLYSFAGLDLDFFPEYLGVELSNIAADINNRLVVLVSELAKIDPYSSSTRDYEQKVRLFRQEPLFAKFGILEGTMNIDNPLFKQVTVKALPHVG